MHPDNVTAARELGKAHGESWGESARGLDVTYEDVPDPLSGEWAGEPTPSTVLGVLAGTDAWDSVFTDWEAGELLDAYEDAFREAYVTSAGIEA